MTVRGLRRAGLSRSPWGLPHAAVAQVSAGAAVSYQEPCWARCPVGSFLRLHCRLPAGWKLSWCSLSESPRRCFSIQQGAQGRNSSSILPGFSSERASQKKGAQGTALMIQPGKSHGMSSIHPAHSSSPRLFPMSGCPVTCGLLCLATRL